ncbi:MAG: hypothetical protein K2I72_03130, partial [Bacilli bacterium]|nr:hypothetical protein [Bacilli bacterium]
MTTPSPTPKQSSEEDNTSTNVTPIHNVVKVQEEAEPALDLAQYFSEVSSSYQVELGDDSFLLPQIEVGNGMFLKVEYYLKGLYEDHYVKVSDFNIRELGTYKVVYTLSYKGQSYTQETFIEILDTEAPIVEGMIETYDSTTGITSYEPVRSGSKINQNIQISFRDNHEISYAEYYKAKYEIIDNVETIEQEGMQEIVEIDLDQDLVFYEDGEYHVRVYDFSSNVTEYIVTIDRTNPIVHIKGFRIDNDKDHISVTIESQEELQAIDGWSLSEDCRSISKIYTYYDQKETVIVYDLAGNPTPIDIDPKTVPVYDLTGNPTPVDIDPNTVLVYDLTGNLTPEDIKFDDVVVSIKIYQEGVETPNISLNTNGGKIQVVLESNRNIELRYSIVQDPFEQAQFETYQGGELTTPGHYTFQAI